MPRSDRRIAASTVGAGQAAAPRRAPRVTFAGADRLTLEAPSLFEEGEGRLRRLVARAFLVPEVRSVVLLHAQGAVRIELSGTLDPARAWRRLGLVLQDDTLDEAPLLDAARPLELRALVPAASVRVTRVGEALTTFRVRVLGSTQLRIAHPLLRRRDVLFRVRETLVAIHGVAQVRTAPFRSGLVVVFDPRSVEVGQIVRQLDLSWPHFIAGFAPPPVPRKLALAGGLLALSTAAQFFNPALMPVAFAAAVLYSAPNLVAALRDLARGRVGLPALYSAGLGFLLWNRLPFASSIMATLSQAWPALAQRLAGNAERRLFVEHRRRLVWARRIDPDQGETIVALDRLAPGDLIVVRAGEPVPADGEVTEGYAAIDEHAVLGGHLVSDKSVGDRVRAGSHVYDGTITVRVERTGERTALAALSARLPYGALTHLPSSREAERLADRNARPALALAAAVLLVTRTPRLAQVTIRPDYATAPRLSAHLSALSGLAESLSDGVLLRDPGVIDRLRDADLYVFDDTLDLLEREFVVRTVRAPDRFRGREALALALAAFDGTGDPRTLALQREAKRRGVPLPPSAGRRRIAGAVRFLDETGGLVTVATLDYVRRAGLAQKALTAASGDEEAGDAGNGASVPLFVLRGRDLVGTVVFARQGARTAATALAALRAHTPKALFVHLSGQPQEVAETHAANFGFDAVFGGLDDIAKAETIRSLGGRAIWIGNGADRLSAPARLASHVSVSVAGIDALADEQADIALLQGDPRALLATLAAADRHATRLNADYRTVYATNLGAVLGGFVVGFGSLSAGLISNTGTALVFLSRWRALRDLAEGFARQSRARPAEGDILVAPRTTHIGRPQR